MFIKIALLNKMQMNDLNISEVASRIGWSMQEGPLKWVAWVQEDIRAELWREGLFGKWC